MRFFCVPLTVNITATFPGTAAVIGFAVEVRAICISACWSCRVIQLRQRVAIAKPSALRERKGGGADAMGYTWSHY